MNPNQQLNTIGLHDFIFVFSDAIENLALYRGIKIDDDLLTRMLGLLFNMTRGKFSNLVVNDVNIGIGQLYEQDIKKVTPQLLNNMMQKVSVEKFQAQDEAEQANIAKHIDLSYWGRAMTLRMLHDKGGDILKREGDTLKEVMECVKTGYCYYTGNKIYIEDLK